MPLNASIARAVLGMSPTGTLNNDSLADSMRGVFMFISTDDSENPCAPGPRENPRYEADADINREVVQEEG